MKSFRVEKMESGQWRIRVMWFGIPTAQFVNFDSWWCTEPECSLSYYNHCLKSREFVEDFLRAHKVVAVEKAMV